jgi:hypothetical protein
VKNLHHKPEKKSVSGAEGFTAQTLVWWRGNRLRKIVCQDLLSHFLSVILWAVPEKGPSLKVLAESGDADVKA